jgi:hypothetical protein
MSRLPHVVSVSLLVERALNTLAAYVTSNVETAWSRYATGLNLTWYSAYISGFVQAGQPANSGIIQGRSSLNRSLFTPASKRVLSGPCDNRDVKTPPGSRQLCFACLGCRSENSAGPFDARDKECSLTCTVLSGSGYIHTIRSSHQLHCTAYPRQKSHDTYSNFQLVPCEQFVESCW